MKDGKIELNGRNNMSLKKSKPSDFDLFSLVDSIIKESVNEYDEEESWEDTREEIENQLKQFKHADALKKPSGKKKKLKSSSQKKKEEFDIIEDEEEDDDKKEDDDKEKPEPTSLNLSDALKYETFKETLNLVRSGHSYDSEPTKTELKDYYDSLTKEEKQVCHILIKGLTHVTLMDVKGKSAKTPSDMSFKITRTGVTSKEKEKSLDNRISAEKQGKKVDNNTPIKTPIKIGESFQNKTEILKVLNENS